MLADHFTEVFRKEHRTVRDTLLELIEAFQAKDKEKIGTLLNAAAGFVGPHFRYEEESLYPSLVPIFGEDYVGVLLKDHDRAIGNAARLVQLAGHDPITDEDVTEAVKLIRKILPHVSDCDGLSIMVERLSEDKVQSILDVREKSWQEGLDLFKWADTIRNRPYN